MSVLSFLLAIRPIAALFHRTAPPAFCHAFLGFPPTPTAAGRRRTTAATARPFASLPRLTDAPPNAAAETEAQAALSYVEDATRTDASSSAPFSDVVASIAGDEQDEDCAAGCAVPGDEEEIRVDCIDPSLIEIVQCCDSLVRADEGGGDDDYPPVGNARTIYPFVVSLPRRNAIICARI